ncbi:MAG: hypothetical protein QM831_31550 [Kofleriaceae bacterium]
MIGTYEDDWASHSGFSPSHFRDALVAFVADPLKDVGEYFILLGRLVRARTTEGERALEIAVKRLHEVGEKSAFLAALELSAEQFTRAAERLAQGRSSAELGYQTLEARDDLESLRSLVTIAAASNANASETKHLDVLIDSAARLAFELDANAEALNIATLILESLKHSRELGRLDALLMNDPDVGGWWLSIVVRDKYRSQLEEIAHNLPKRRNELFRWLDERVLLEAPNGTFDQVLERWKLSVALDWNDTRSVHLIRSELEELIDLEFDYQEVDTGALRQAGRAIQVLADTAAFVLRNSGPSRRVLLAYIVTACMTLLDRIRGNLPSTARLPVSLAQVMFALNSWRIARNLENPVASKLGDLLVAHWTKRGGSSGDRVLAAVAVALQYLKRGDARWATHWLKCAYQIVSANGSIFAPTAVLVGAYVEVARSLPPVDGLTLFQSVDRLAQLLRERAHKAGKRYRPFVELRAAVVRGYLLDAIGDADGAVAAREEGLRVIRGFGELEGHERYALLAQETQLCTDLGNIRDAARAMELYELDLLRQQPRTYRSRMSATAMKYRRALLWIAHGYHSEGIVLLDELATSGFDPWRSYAAAALAYPQSLGIAGADVRIVLGAQTQWGQLEQRAQKLYTYARRVSRTPFEKSALAEALGVNEELRKRKPRDISAAGRHAQLLMLRNAEGDLSAAEAILDGIADSRDEYVLSCFGQLEFRRKHFVAAADYFRTAYEISPSIETATMLANALTATGQSAEALSTLDSHKRYDAPMLDARGMAHIEQGNYDDAWRDLEAACKILAENPEALSERFVGIARRLSLIAEKVVSSDRSMVLEFAKRDLRYVASFTSACMTRFAFDTKLCDVLLDAADSVRNLRFVLAKYAMGGAVYFDTHGEPGEARNWLSKMWDRLELKGSSLLIAELLASAKSVYAKAVGSAFDGESTVARRGNFSDWLKQREAPNETLLRHVASLEQNANYYRGAADIVAVDQKLCSEKEVFLDQAAAIISSVRRTAIGRLGLESHLVVLSQGRPQDEHIAAMWTANECLGPAPEIIAAPELGFGVSTLVCATGHTLKLLLTQQQERPRLERVETGLKLTWPSQQWSDACVRVLEGDDLSPSQSDAHVIVPFAIQRGDLPEYSN